MLTQIVFIAVALFVLAGLINSTERALALHQRHAEKDVRFIDHHSRM